MTASQRFYYYLNINVNEFSKKELVILEGVLFTHICKELKFIFYELNKNYFRCMKFSNEKENRMIEDDFIRCIINDILSTEEYTLQGIAYATDIPEDVIFEIASGFNTRPTFALARKIMELHQSVRSDLYRSIINKLMNVPTMKKL